MIALFVCILSVINSSFHENLQKVFRICLRTTPRDPIETIKVFLLGVSSCFLSISLASMAFCYHVLFFPPVSLRIAGVSHHTSSFWPRWPLSLSKQNQFDLRRNMAAVYFHYITYSIWSQCHLVLGDGEKQRQSFYIWWYHWSIFLLLVL